MNSLLGQLQPYPFQRLRETLGKITPNQSLAPLRLSIGEPVHRPPAFVSDILAGSGESLRKYPATGGTESLKKAIGNWATNRFSLPTGALDPSSMVLPCNGTREALFSIVQTVVDPKSSSKPLVIMPNPFYQIYEGAAILAGAEPYFVDNDDLTQKPDFSSISPDIWQRCAICFICTPGNPSGISLDLSELQELIGLARKYDFVLASDECYSELYLDESRPSVGILDACISAENSDFKNCLAFHSLSKRSNLAGLRSGFVAGDPAILEKFLLYRTYHGSAMSLQNQAASTAAWNDESHVVENRALYREKYELLCPMIAESFEFNQPDSGFYLWIKTPTCDIEFAKDLYRNQHLTVLPGSFLGRDVNGRNPGAGYIRLALVSPIEECKMAVNRLLTEARCQPS